MGNVRIDEVHTEITITDSVGPLSPEETRKLIQIVVQHLRAMDDHAAHKRADDSVGDRNYQSRVNEGR